MDFLNNLNLTIQKIGQDIRRLSMAVDGWEEKVVHSVHWNDFDREVDPLKERIKKLEDSAGFNPYAIPNGKWKTIVPGKAWYYFDFDTDPNTLWVKVDGAWTSTQRVNLNIYPEGDLESVTSDFSVPNGQLGVTNITYDGQQFVFASTSDVRVKGIYQMAVNTW